MTDPKPIGPTAKPTGMTISEAAAYLREHPFELHIEADYAYGDKCRAVLAAAWLAEHPPELTALTDDLDHQRLRARLSNAENTNAHQVQANAELKAELKRIKGYVGEALKYSERPHDIVNDITVHGLLVAALQTPAGVMPEGNRKSHPTSGDVPWSASGESIHIAPTTELTAADETQLREYRESLIAANRRWAKRGETVETTACPTCGAISDCHHSSWEQKMVPTLETCPPSGCPKCGAALRWKDHEGCNLHVEWQCRSFNRSIDGRFVQSDKCRIAELEASLDERNTRINELEARLAAVTAELATEKAWCQFITTHPEEHVCWVRYTNRSIVTCDQDAPKAFKVYKRPKQADTDRCCGCCNVLKQENAWMEDGCPCNSPRGCNEGNRLIAEWRLTAATARAERAEAFLKMMERWAAAPVNSEGIKRFGEYRLAYWARSEHSGEKVWTVWRSGDWDNRVAVMCILSGMSWIESQEQAGGGA